MVDIVITATVTGVPTNGLPDPPEVEIIRSDTGAVVQAFVAMTDLLVSGKYGFTFAPTVTLDYAFTVDADPNVTGQVGLEERFFDGSFPGNIDILADTGDLVNLDATVSSRATQSSVDAIQNNTRFVGVVPAVLVLPTAGTTTYRLFGRLFDTAGNPEDPDANTMNIRIEDAAGGVVVATVAMTRTGVGLYQFDYVVNAADTERQLNVFLEYLEATVAFQQVRTTVVREFETKLDDILVAVETDIPATLAALNDIAVSDILAAVLASGNTVNVELSGILVLRDFLEGGRDIDFVGNDALGWQRIERNVAGVLQRRYNLFDEGGARITGTVAAFISAQKMIASEVAI